MKNIKMSRVIMTAAAVVAFVCCERQGASSLTNGSGDDNGGNGNTEYNVARIEIKIENGIYSAVPEATIDAETFKNYFKGEWNVQSLCDIFSNGTASPDNSLVVLGHIWTKLIVQEGNAIREYAENPLYEPYDPIDRTGTYSYEPEGNKLSFEGIMPGVSAFTIMYIDENEFRAVTQPYLPKTEDTVLSLWTYKKAE